MLKHIIYELIVNNLQQYIYASKILYKKIYQILNINILKSEKSIIYFKTILFIIKILLRRSKFSFESILI